MTTRSAEETRALGRALGSLAQPGDVILLRGELGAGKTTLAQGIAAGLRIEEAVSSPTFTLVQEYAGRLPLWHVDAYRLRGPDEALDLGLEEAVSGGAVVLVEWPERIEPALPAVSLEVRLRPGEGDDREILLAGEGRRAGILSCALERITAVPSDRPPDSPSSSLPEAPAACPTR